MDVLTGLGLVFICFLMSVVLFRDIWKFFRGGFGSGIEINYNASALDGKYYIESDSLFKEYITFDAQGVAARRYGNALFYNPAYVAWHGLCILNNYYDSRNGEHLKALQKQISWLKSNSFADGRRGRVWHYEFDWREGSHILKNPWISGMAQGLIISLLVRTYALTGDKDLLNMAAQAANVYKMSIEKGGIRLEENSFVYYEEYPVTGGIRILDGFIFAILGLYDLFEAAKNEEYLTMFKEGVNTLEENICYWDYRHRWSRYGRHRFLCTPLYNRLNSQLLHVLYTISGRDVFLEYASAWNAGALSLSEKSEVLIAFVITRNTRRAAYLLSRFQSRRG